MKVNIVITYVNPKGNFLLPFMHIHLKKKKLKKKSHNLFDKPVSGLKELVTQEVPPAKWDLLLRDT